MNFKNNIPYFMYMAEAEGVDSMVNTRTARINAIGRELREAGYAGQVVPSEVFVDVCRKHGVTYVSTSEIDRIIKEWL